MAYSNIENLYLTRQAEQVFPTMPEEQPAPEAVQLAAGPSSTMTDAGGGVATIKPLPQTTIERALEGTGLTLEQAGRFLYGLGQVDLPVLGKVSLADLVPFVGNPKDDTGQQWQGTPKTLQQMGTGVGSMLDRVTTGTGMARQLNEDAKLTAMDVAFNAVPVAKTVAKAATKSARVLAPKAGQMAEDYLTKTGAILRIAPDIPGPGLEVPTAGNVTAPAFKKWFGKSKLVDDKGQPLVLYHGTKAEDVEEFAFDRRRNITAADFYFTPNKETAAVYGNPIPVYLKSENLIDIRPDNLGTKEMDALRNVYKAIGDDYGFDDFDSFIDVVTGGKMYEVGSNPRFQNAVLGELNNMGFDGVRMIDAGFRGALDESVIVFNAGQIKSVFNKGTWNPNDPRILHGAGGATAAGAAATQDKEQK